MFMHSRANTDRSTGGCAQCGIGGEDRRRGPNRLTAEELGVLGHCFHDLLDVTGYTCRRGKLKRHSSYNGELAIANKTSPLEVFGKCACSKCQRGTSDEVGEVGDSL